MSPAGADPCLLTVRGLSKSYGSVPALADVDLEVRAGEIHALVGENGAGKSTLCKILCGLLRPDAGTIALNGRAYAPRGRRDADRSGVRMVMQELNLLSTLTVAESLFLDCLPHRWGWIDRRRLRDQALQALKRVGLTQLDPEEPVRSLGIGQQQLVEIAAGLARHCRLLILDEPTAALTDPEIANLFARLTELRAAGTGIIYISHRMEELRRIADRISVLRDGRWQVTRDAADFPLDQIVRAMVGRDLAKEPLHTARQPGPVALRVRGLCAEPGVREVSFEVHEGEILGVAGLMGSGRTETMRALFGADRRSRGEIFLSDTTDRETLRSPRQAVRRGMALLTENRKEQGLLLPLSVRINATLACVDRLSNSIGWLSSAVERSAASHWTRALGLRCRDDQQPVGELSGGNQQKVILARWLMRDCRILIMDEPTRGIDVGAKLEIYRLLDRLATEGKAIVLVSSDLQELMHVADRIAVMSAGRWVQTFARGRWTRDDLMRAALSGYAPSPTS